MRVDIGFSNSDKRLIESRDVVFIEDTKLITLLEQIKNLLHVEYEESDSYASDFSVKILKIVGENEQVLNL